MRARGLAIVGVAIVCGDVDAACDLQSLRYLRDKGFAVAEAMAWCEGGAVPDAGAPKAAAQPRSSNAPATPPTPKQDAAADMVSNSPRADAGAPNPAPAGKSTTSASVTDKNVFTGTPPDSVNGQIRTKVRIPGVRVAADFDHETKDGTPASFDLPADTYFLITNDVIETPRGRDKAVEMLYGRVAFQKGDKRVKADANQNKSMVTQETGSNAPYVIRDDVEYVVERAAFANHENLREGYTYGILTAPYKFYPKDHSFTSSVTVGPYFGYELTWLGMSGKVIASFGLTSVPVPSKKENGDPTTTNKAALSWSTGLLWDLNNKFQMGVLIGADTLGPNSGYQYNGKPWAAIDIGYKFSN